MTFQQIYDEHFAFVWRALRRLGVREADTADAAQEVFLVVYRKLAEFEGRSRVSTWLFGICLRVARDRQRLAHVRREVLDEEGVAAERGGDAVEDIERREALGQLEKALNDMEFDQRVIFAMFELEGMTGEEIAEVVQAPLGTVYSRLRLARESFRRSASRLQARERGDWLAAGGDR
jgi:RNA polymerase sigma-70 factor (ECF subfamily)